MEGNMSMSAEAAYEPAESEIEEYGKWLGMNLPEDSKFLWIARQGLEAPLPKFWKACKSEKGDLYYFNFKTGESIWDHPLDEQFKQLFKTEKEKSLADRSLAALIDTDANKVTTLPPASKSIGDEEQKARLHSPQAKSKRKLGKLDKMKDSAREKAGAAAENSKLSSSSSTCTTTSSVSSTLSPIAVPTKASGMALVRINDSLRDEDLRTAACDAANPCAQGQKPARVDTLGLPASPPLVKAQVGAVAGGGINALKALTRKGRGGSSARCDIGAALDSLSDETAGLRAIGCGDGAPDQVSEWHGAGPRAEDGVVRKMRIETLCGIDACLLDEKYRREKILLEEIYQRELNNFELQCIVESDKEKARVRGEVRSAIQRYRERQEQEWADHVSSMHDEMHARQAELRAALINSFERLVQASVREQGTIALELMRAASDEFSRAVAEHKRSRADVLLDLRQTTQEAEASAEALLSQLKAAHQSFVVEAGHAQRRMHALSALKVFSPEPVAASTPAHGSSRPSSDPSSLAQSSPRSSSSCRRVHGDLTEDARCSSGSMNELRLELERDVRHMRLQMQHEMREELQKALKQMRGMAPTPPSTETDSPSNTDHSKKTEWMQKTEHCVLALSPASVTGGKSRPLAPPPLIDDFRSLSDNSGPVAYSPGDKVLTGVGSLRSIITEAVCHALREVSPSKPAASKSPSHSFSKDGILTPCTCSSHVCTPSAQNQFHCLSPFASTSWSASRHVCSGDRRTSSAPAIVASDHVNQASPYDVHESMSASFASMPASRSKLLTASDSGQVTASPVRVVRNDTHGESGEWNELLSLASRKSDQLSLRRHELHLAKRRWKMEMRAAKWDGVRSVSTRGQKLRAEHARLQRELDVLARDQAEICRIESWLTSKLTHSGGEAPRAHPASSSQTMLSKDRIVDSTTINKNNDCPKLRRASLHSVLVAGQKD